MLFRKKKLHQLLVASSIIAAAIFTTTAFAFELAKPITALVPITNPTAQQKANGVTQKQVRLMNIKLTEKEKQILFSYNPKKAPNKAKIYPILPPNVDLGMNNTPVLDQGIWGTCVTFATTAAIDAQFGQGDYVSQLCSLELGKYLSNQGYLPDAWMGSFAPWVFGQLTQFGIVSKTRQHQQGCGGLTEYPAYSAENGTDMSLEDYHKISEGITQLYPIYYMNFLQRFDSQFADNDQADDVLIKVKSALAKGNRLTFGTFLVISPYCSVGACASYHAKHDTWALTSEINHPPFETAGHEMVITGYDDNAVATDNNGNQYQGLLILRNSWSDQVGDHGNYYMTYDYFKKFVGEVQELALVKDQ